MAGAAAWMVRHAMAAWAVSGLLLLVGGVVVVALPYHHSLSTARAYRTTPEAVVVSAVVTDLRNISNGKGCEYRVEVRGTATVSGRIELDDSDPVLSQLSRGDRVGIELWHGRRTGITFDGQVQETVTAPTLEPGLWLAGGLVLLHGGVLAFHTAVRLRRRTHESSRFWPGPEGGLTPTGKVIAGSAAAACIAGVAASHDLHGHMAHARPDHPRRVEGGAPGSRPGMVPGMQAGRVWPPATEGDTSGAGRDAWTRSMP
ncbi:hypothetical protein [Streptomyces chiangmaiensis]|uniref:DUF3592 domain-containing protein n=1 Tax=Streptomyces chiangmaiensis TaxID=766497 RepID=A0ABU7FG78_9ACTN|nr:hypothetical protein [Streptomyces chiangmaiensis]MED7823085.1 hypothetical protein [Streptomyces chiangmaiensis]